MLGLPSLTNEGSRELETSSVLNVIYQLLQLYRHNLKTIDHLKERYAPNNLAYTEMIDIHNIA